MKQNKTLVLSLHIIELCALINYRNDQNDTQRPHYVLDTASIKPGPGEQSCPRCGGAVFAAEQMLARGTVSPPRFSLIPRQKP